MEAGWGSPISINYMGKLSCGVTICTYLCTEPADLAAHPQLGVYYGIG